MKTAADFERPEIEALVAAVTKLANVRLDAGAAGAVVIRADDQKKRAQRAPKPSRTAAKTRPAKRRG
jgi:hypothetical protein